MTLFVLSDLHLDESAPDGLFRESRQGRQLARLCRTVLEDDDPELVFLGDTFDFTAMQPPARGLAAFAEHLRFDLDVPPQRDVAAMLEAIARVHPETFDALRTLAERVPVTFAIGNHDRHLADRGAGAALARIGLGHARVAERLVREVAGRTVCLEHGHRWDVANASHRGGGELFTRIVHQAVLPYLRAHGTRRQVRIEPVRVVATRPQARVISILQRWLSRDEFGRLVDGVLELLEANGGVPWFARALRPFITSARLRRRVAEDDRRWIGYGDRALDTLEGNRRLARGVPRPDVLVLGHTHTLDWLATGDAGRERLYVNLGTWTERAVDAVGPLDPTLPCLRVEENGDEFDARLLDLDVDDEGGELERFVTRPRPGWWARRRRRHARAAQHAAAVERSS